MKYIVLCLCLCLLSSCQEQKKKTAKKAPEKVKAKPLGPSPEEVRAQRIKEKIAEIKEKIKEAKDFHVNTKVSITTLAGVEFKNAEIMDWNPLKIHLYSPKGLELVGIKELSKEEGEKVGFDHKLAADYSSMMKYLKKKKSQSTAGVAVAKQIYKNPFVDKFKSTLVMANGSKSDGGIASKKFTLLYFSASWCPPCQRFTPSLVSSNGSFNNLNCGVVLVSGDQQDSAMFNYMKSKKMPWPAVSYNSRRSADLEKYGQRFIPSLALIDSNGKMVLQGSGSSQTLDKVAAHLKANQ